MTNLSRFLACVALAAAPVVTLVASTPASAAVDPSDPQRFITTLTDEGFAAMKGGNRAAAKTKFKQLLMGNVATDLIGNRLLGQYRAQATPAQLAAFKAALPTYIVGTYADRLFEYADADVKVLRSQPAGAGADVMSQVVRPGRQPMPAVWSVVKVGSEWKVANIRVAGINVAMAQAADFASVIQRQGFDALIKMMQARG